MMREVAGQFRIRENNRQGCCLKELKLRPCHKFYFLGYWVQRASEMCDMEAC